MTCIQWRSAGSRRLFATAVASVPLNADPSLEPMSVRRSRAHRAISDRWVTRRATLGLALVAGLSGLVLGSCGHQAGLAAPPASSGAAADDTGSASPDSAPPSTAAAPSTASPATLTRAADAKSVPSTTATAKSRTTAAAAAPAINASAYEQQVLSLTNAQRTANGCPALTWNSALGSVARAHSQDMAAKNYFDHNTLNGTTPAQRLTAAGYTYRQMAENIAAGQATPAAVMSSWMGSAGHKANILNCALTELGVGYATGGAYGSYWTQDFGTR